MKESLLKRMYNIVLSQAISESGKFLFAGNRFGDIFIQDIEELDNTDKPRSRLRMYSQGINAPINSLIFHHSFLIVGTVGIIYGLKWDEEKGKLSTKRDWEIAIPQNAESIELADVNSLCLSKESGTLYAGCGDNIIYQISLDDGRIKRQFQEHRDYIHCITECDGRLYSASEDGTVLLWSPSKKESVSKLEPNKINSIARPEFGKWIGSISVSSDWVICGGGPKLSLWHLRSLEWTKDFDFPEKIHCCDFVDETIIVAGEHSSAHLYTLGGESLAVISLEHTIANSIVWQNDPINFMSIAGYSNKLHILSDFRYLDSNIELYNNVDCRELGT